MTTIGTAVLQIIPSLDGVSASIDKQLGGTLKATGKRGGKQFADGLVDGTKQAEAALNKVATAAEKFGDKQKDAADRARLAQLKLTEAQEKGLSGSRLAALQNARDKALRQETAATRDLTRANEQLERAKKDAADAASSPSSAGGESAGGAFLEGFGGAVAAIGTKAGPIGLALTAAGGVALAAGGLIATQVLAGMEREAAADKIQAQLGLSDASAAQFGRSAGEVYGNNFGESLTDVNDSMAAVASTFTDLGGTALEGLTEKALTFRDVFGTDVAESVAAAQNLIVNGLASDGTQAFDLLTTSFQRVPAAMRDELPEILNEYATNFQSLGFSGEEAMGMLVAAAPRGAIVLDKIGDSLKEFTLLATDLGSKPVQDALSGLGLDGQTVANNLLAGGDTAQTQFDGIIDKLTAIKDPAEQAAAAVALFGTPLEDLDKSKIPQFLDSLDQAGATMDGFSGSAQNMVDTVGDNAASSLETAKRSIETAMAGMQDGLADAFGPQIEQFAGWVSSHGPQITEFFTGVGRFATLAGEQVLLFVADSIGALADLVNVVGDVHGGMLRFGANLKEMMGDDEGAAQWRKEAEAAFGLADSLYAAEGGARAAAGAMGEAADTFGDTQRQAQLVGENVDRIAGLMAALPNGKQIDLSVVVTYKDQNGLVIPPDQLRNGGTSTSAEGEVIPGATSQERRGRAGGGPITGPGGPTSDIIPIWASNGEHMWTAEEVNAVGGQGNMYRMRAAARAGAFGKFAEGGAIGGGLGDAAKRFAASMDPAKYAMGGFSPKAFDCSGFVSAVANVATGRDPFSSRMSTVTEGSWLKSLGFQPGNGGPGDLRIGWWDKGGGANGHTAGTLPDGTNFESTSGGVRIGGPVGADAKQFTSRAFLPMSAEPTSEGGDLAPAPDGGTGASAAPSSAATSSSGGGGGPLPTSFTGLSRVMLDGLGTGVGTLSNGRDLSDFGNAAGTAVGDQLGSVLGVAGINDSPPFLQGISTFLSGTKVGGNDRLANGQLSGKSDGSLFDGSNLFSFGQGSGASAAPISASPTAGAAALPQETVHGSRAGQAPGTTVNYNIRTATVEDAFLQSRRKEALRAAAKVSKF